VPRRIPFFVALVAAACGAFGSTPDDSEDAADAGAEAAAPPAAPAPPPPKPPPPLADGAPGDASDPCAGWRYCFEFDGALLDGWTKRESDGTHDVLSLVPHGSGKALAASVPTGAPDPAFDFLRLDLPSTSAQIRFRFDLKMTSMAAGDYIQLLSFYVPSSGKEIVFTWTGTTLLLSELGGAPGADYGSPPTDFETFLGTIDLAAPPKITMQRGALPAQTVPIQAPGAAYRFGLGIFYASPSTKGSIQLDDVRLTL
jgi:hypothetical protein